MGKVIKWRQVERAVEGASMNLLTQEPASVSSYYTLFLTDPQKYREWLSGEIDEDSKRFSNRRRYPRGMFPISYRRRELYFRLLGEVHGTKCKICAFSGRLELAHLAYFEDSVGPKERQQSASLRRMIEALEHPDRIVRLCSLCHDIFDYSRKHGGMEYLRRIEALMFHAEEVALAS